MGSSVHVALLALFVAIPITAAAQSRVIVLRDRADLEDVATSLRVELASRGTVVVAVVGPEGDTVVARDAEAQRQAMAANADAAIWATDEGALCIVRVVPRAAGDVRHASLASHDPRGVAVVAASLLAEMVRGDPVTAPALVVRAPAETIVAVSLENDGGADVCRVRDATGAMHVLDVPIRGHTRGVVHLPSTVARDDLTFEDCGGAALWSGRVTPDGPTVIDYAAPGPTSPLILALAARASVGAVWGGTTTIFAVLQGEARIGVAIGDYGVGLILRVGADELASALGSYSVAGTWFAGEALVALLGTRSPFGFFARGAYFGLGVAAAMNVPTIVCSLHQPLIWLSDATYLGADMTGYVAPVGGYTDRSGQGPFGAISLGLEIVLSD